VGIRDSGGTRVDLELGSGDWNPGDETLNVTETTNGWTLSQEEPPGSVGYRYESPGDEGLSPGPHTLTFLIRDNNTPTPNEVTFQRDIYIFNSYPLLTSPSNGATGVSTTPTFEWGYNGIAGAFYYGVAVWDGSDPDSATQIWHGYQIADGSTSYSLTIPADKALAPNTTYYWAVWCATESENGEARSDIRSFTTGGTDWPAPSFEWFVVWGRNTSSGTYANMLASVVGPSPADIRELTVSRDGGGYFYRFTQDDMIYHFQHGMHHIHEDQVPPDGTYTFFVEDKKGRTASQSRSFTSRALPIVSSGITPADSTYGNTTTPTFSWEPVGAEYYYRVLIMYWNYEAIVYFSPLSTGTIATVPPGILLPNTPYKWRIEVHDGSDWGVANNLSTTDWMRFSTGPYPYTIDVNFGIVWSSNSYYGGQSRLLSTHIIGPLPNHVSYLSVTGPGYSYDFTEGDLGYDRDDGAIYVHGESGYPSDGTYDFYVQDVYLATDTYPKDFTLSEIAIADRSAFLPENNAYLNTLTPTLSWDPVSGSPRYYRVLVEDWRRRVIIYESPRSTDTFATIPAGVLQPNSSYMWRVEVYDDSDPLVADNRSTSGWYCFTTPSREGVPSVISDFDGDGETDNAIYRRASGVWWIYPSLTGTPYPVGFGGHSSDIAVAEDYDGDGEADIAIFRAVSGIWWIYPSSTGTPYPVGFGGHPSDMPVNPAVIHLY